MSVQNGERLVTKQDLADMYQGILPYLGGMPEVLANKFSKGDMYSTDEKMIGQWINNKPVYQRTVQNTTLTTISNSSWDNYCSISGIENLVSWQFGRMNASGNVVDVMGDISCWYDANTSYLKVRSRTDNLSCTNGSVITIQYTKTTDTAISIGSDTDYSTEEKIIGTWIDGKPIYQKSYVVQNQVSISENTWNTILSSVGFISVLIDVNINGTKISNPYAFRKNNSNIECYLAGVSDTIYSNDVITIRYTKTT